MNFVETMPQLIIFNLYCGYYLPYYTMYIAIANCVARPIYAVLYVSGGSNNRYISVFAGLLPIQILTFYVFATKVPMYANLVYDQVAAQ